MRLTMKALGRPEQAEREAILEATIEAMLEAIGVLNHATNGPPGGPLITQNEPEKSFRSHFRNHMTGTLAVPVDENTC